MRLVVIVGLQAQTTAELTHAQEDVAHVAVGEIAPLARQHVLGGAGSNAWELVFKEGLIGNAAHGRTASQQAANGVVGLGESLARSRVLKHVRRLRQIDGLRQIAGEASDIGEIEDEAAGQFALQAEVDVVALAELRERVDLERQCLRQILRCHRDRRGGHRWQRNAAVNADPIERCRRVAGGGIATRARCTGLRTFRSVDADGLAEADAEHRDQDVLHQV